MSLTDFRFILFFFAVYFGMWLLKWILEQKKCYVCVNKLVLLASSYVFMALIDYRFCICIFLLSLLAYFIAILCEKYPEKKIIIGVGVFCSIMQLAIFKYLNFFAASFTKLLGTEYVAVNLIIPIGVSFYTFSALSYMIDVYRKKYASSKDFIDVVLYISFFPKLTSGPIMRANKFFEQLNQGRYVSIKNLEVGIQIVLVGFFKKMVLADHLAIFVNDVFNTPTAFSGGTVFLATLSYSLQIYFDFAGYSDIAIGFSKMLGFDLDKNFDLPYVSKNPTELWKRWHISLSSWLQEYLYYSLGGNRKGKLRTKVNLVLTMLIGGLWHGANWTFIFWGAIHGIALVVHKLFIQMCTKKTNISKRFSLIGNVISVILMFGFTNFCWIFFRADSMDNAFVILNQILSGAKGISQPFAWFFLSVLVVFGEFAIAFWHRKQNSGKLQNNYIILDLNKVVSLTVFFVFAGITIMMAYIGNTAFIYGNF